VAHSLRPESRKEVNNERKTFVEDVGGDLPGLASYGIDFANGRGGVST
jgi:hypothetical protein